MKLGGAQKWSEHYGEFALPVIEFQLSNFKFIAIPTELLSKNEHVLTKTKGRRIHSVRVRLFY
jgi:hypothetical protein